MALIEMTKQYRTRDGRPARVLCVDRVTRTGRPVMAMVKHSDGTEDGFYYTEKGSIRLDSHQDDCDLIEVTPYDGLKIDDLVMVKGSAGSWCIRRFAGVSVKDKPLVWAWGACSATTGAVVEFADCRLATPQEIEAARKYNMENAK